MFVDDIYPLFLLTFTMSMNAGSALIKDHGSLKARQPATLTHPYSNETLLSGLVSTSLEDAPFIKSPASTNTTGPYCVPRLVVAYLATLSTLAGHRVQV